MPPLPLLFYNSIIFMMNQGAAACSVIFIMCSNLKICYKNNYPYWSQQSHKTFEKPCKIRQLGFNCCNENLIMIVPRGVV